MTDPAEILVHARALARAHREPEALRLLDATGGRAVVGARVELLVATGQFDLARAALGELRRLDPWRSGLELLWMAYWGQARLDEVDVPALLAAEDDRPPTDRCRLALGLGKVSSDAGDLDLARAWLLVALRRAREALDQDLVAASCGAFGEVLYLGGRVLEALDLLTLDAALLPAGSTHVERLMTYRAHAYRQLGQVAAARSLYEEALQAARLRGHGVAWPLRGVLWCAALEQSTGRSPASAGREIEQLLADLRAEGEPHSLGHGLLARAWLAAGEERAALVREARASFARGGYGHETAWCDRLLGEPGPALGPGPDWRPATGPMACDGWLSAFVLEDPSERRTTALTAFGAASLEAGTAWMGAFF